MRRDAMKIVAAVLLLLPIVINGGKLSVNNAQGSRARGPGPGDEAERVPPSSENGALSLNERIAAQTAIERVFYEKRIWPKENPQPKPPFEKMVPNELIEKKVNESLLMSAALEKYWQRSITPEMLQDRKSTRLNSSHRL